MGDWNAVVGALQPGDDEETVGLRGIGPRNPRGEWLAQWASSQQLSITNTFFERNFEKQWTHQIGRLKRQIDYGLIISSSRGSVLDAEACDDIGVGADHRTVKLVQKLPVPSLHAVKPNNKKRGHVSMRGWVPANQDSFNNKLDRKLHEFKVSVDTLGADLQQTCRTIEEMLLEIAVECRQVQSTLDREHADGDMRLRELIDRRRLAKSEGCKDLAKTVSKQILKEIRAIQKARKTARATRILRGISRLEKDSEHPWRRQSPIHRRIDRQKWFGKDRSTRCCGSICRLFRIDL